MFSTVVSLHAKLNQQSAVCDLITSNRKRHITGSYMTVLEFSGLNLGNLRGK